MRRLRARTETQRARRSMHGVCQLPPQRIERFRSVIEQLGEAVQRAPADFESAAAQRNGAKAGPRDPHLARRATRSRTYAWPACGSAKQIIRMSMDFVDQHEGEYLSVEQLAVSAGVSERTLRNAFEQYFGVAPVRYLRHRALDQVRRSCKPQIPQSRLSPRLPPGSAFGNSAASLGITSPSLVNSPPRPCTTIVSAGGIALRLQPWVRDSRDSSRSNLTLEM